MRASSTLESILKAGDAAHAVLLYGPEYGEQERLARSFARARLCGDDEVLGDRFDRGALTDYQEITPTNPGASLTVDYLIESDGKEAQKEAIPLVPYLQTRPIVARCKAMCFHRAHRFTPAAAHKLLKTLEEPPDYALIILTTSDLSAVPDTIRSRCLLVACELAEAEAGASRFDSAVSEGSAKRLAELDEHRSAYEGLERLFEGLDTMVEADALVLADGLRESAAAIAKSRGSGAREANLEAVQCLAAWLRMEHPDRPDRIRIACDAHRYLQGYGYAPLAFDRLAADLLSC